MSPLRALGPLYIANRGEIAARIERSARRLGIETIAVATGPDRGAPYLRQAASSIFLGEDPRLYLDIARNIEAALEKGARAVHPGYGFLAENADFAQACADAGLVFVGPPPSAIRRLGDKAAAKRLALELGISCVPGALAVPGGASLAETPAFPLLIKAAAGGGGRGMRIVESAEELDQALRLAASEAEAAFGRGDLLVEAFLRGARHVEVQVLADRHGNVSHLGERDCSVQRRFQKLIEESPAPGVSPELRRELGGAAVELVRAAGYEGAATVELLLLPDGRFYFLEVNTRLQVEHGVTELVTGLDLVELQLRIAAGEPLPWGSGEPPGLDGHAIELRLCAEDPANFFLPQTGSIAALRLPEGVRIDHSLEEGLPIGGAFDSMLAKILVHGGDRDEARRQAAAALAATFVAGMVTNKAFLLAVLGSEKFRAGGVSTRFVEEELTAREPAAPPAWLQVLAAAWRAERGSPYAGGELWAYRSSGQPAVFYADFELGGKSFELRLECPGGRRYRSRIGGAEIAIEIESERAEENGLEILAGRQRHRVHAALAGADVFLDAGAGAYSFHFGPRRREARQEDPGKVKAPMASRVKLLQIGLGQEVEAGQPLLVLEAMKLEHRLVAQIPGRIAALHVAPGEAVEHRQLLVEIAPL